MPKDMQFNLDFRSGQPIYIQIVHQVRQMIAAGRLNAGDQLPTVRQLAADLRVNFNTVARAYRILDESGLISTQHGRGTYVWRQPDEEAGQRLRLQVLDELTQNYLNSALRMGYSSSEVADNVQKVIAEWDEKGFEDEKSSS